jgi:hypothetical protein
MFTTEAAIPLATSEAVARAVDESSNPVVGILQIHTKIKE